MYVLVSQFLFILEMSDVKHTLFSVPQSWLFISLYDKFLLKTTLVWV